MATALASGCDFFATWSSAPADVAGTVYAGTASHGSSGPPAGTHMSFVGQYLRVLTAGQLAAFNAAGLQVFFYYENSGAGSIQPSFNANYLAATTYAQGVADATDALGALSALGVGAWPVYFAVDYDAGSSQWGALAHYFQGVSDTIGPANTGMYGSVGTYDNVGLGMNSVGYPSPAFFAQSRSSGWHSNANLGADTNIWQWPPGYSPSGGLVINGHGVDGCFAYSSNYGQYPGGGGGSPPPPTSGTLTSASTTNPNMTFSQPQPQAFISTEKHDQVMYSKTFTTNAISNTVGTYTFNGPTTNINQSAYPIGTFTYDNGTTWNDLGFIFASDYGTFPGHLPNIVIQPIVNPNGILTFAAALNTLVPGVASGAPVPVTINIALLVAYLPGDLPTATVQQVGAYTNIQPQSPNKYATYRRISNDTFVTGSGVLSHGLGTLPNIQFWNQDAADSTTIINPVRWSSTGRIVNKFGMKLDNTAITYYLDSGVARSYLRIYRDN